MKNLRIRGEVFLPRVPALLRFLKEEIEQPYKMLYDLSVSGVVG